MASRSRRNQGNRDEDAAAPANATNVLRSLVMAVTQAMTTAISNTTVTVPVMPKTTTYSSDIDPYDNESFGTKTKEGKYRWHLNTKTAEGWKNDGIYATVDHTNNILDLLKYRSVQFGMDNIMNIPTSGTGSFHTTSITIVGVGHWNAAVRDYINILTSYHQISLDQLCALSGWFMGDKMSLIINSSNKKSPVNPTRSSITTIATETGTSTGPPARRFKNTGKTTMGPDTGAKYKWCKLNGRKKEKSYTERHVYASPPQLQRVGRPQVQIQC